MTRIRGLVVASCVVIATAACRRAPKPAADDGRLAVAADPRIDLFAILFRLAGAPGYTRAVGAAVDAIDAHFGAFRGHRAVAETRALARDHGIGFDAPMRLAVYLDAGLRPIRALSPPPPGLDPRWVGVDAEAYLAAVRDFAKASDFDAFERDHLDVQAERRFREFLRGEHVVAWFDDVFGQKPGTSYRIAPSAAVFPMSYSTRAVHGDGTEEVVLAMFLEHQDRGGFEPGDRTREIVVHEIGHSYVNPRVDARMQELEPLAEPLFRRVEDAMRRQAYPSVSIMVEESVTRAMVVAYLRDRGRDAQARQTLADEVSRSFSWTPDLVDSIGVERSKRGGKLPDDALVDATKTAFRTFTERGR